MPTNKFVQNFRKLKFSQIHFLNIEKEKCEDIKASQYHTNVRIYH